MGDYGGRYVEPKGGKRLIYFLIAVIALLLIAAIGIIVYLSSQMMEMKRDATHATPPARQTRPLALPASPTNTAPVTTQADTIAPPQPAKAKPAKKSSTHLATEDIATIVQMVMAQMQKNQPKASPPSETMQLPKPSRPQQKVRPVKPPETPKVRQAAAPEASAPTGELDSMIRTLESADVDTVEEHQPVLTARNTKGLTQARASKSRPKANDNFNKVVVDDSGDDFSQLSSEVDQLVQEERLPESNYEKKMKQEVAERQNEMRTIVVREGDTLMAIAKKAYQDSSKYLKILQANPGIIKNPDRIFVGQVLRVPK